MIRLDSLPAVAHPCPATGNLTSGDGESWRRLGFFGVNIGLILPRLFKFSETVKKMTFSYTIFQS